VTDATDTDRTPNPIDVHVGASVRRRRKALNVSQETLAGRLKLTFQQVQKYERGTNRISASKLYEIARALDCAIADFFVGLPEAGEPITPLSPAETAASRFSVTGVAIDIMSDLSKLPRLQVRAVRALTRSLARAGAGDVTEAEGEVDD
jgi:transcriptional regulator with XRE-family HTH domain